MLCTWVLLCSLLGGFRGLISKQTFLAAWLQALSTSRRAPRSGNRSTCWAMIGMRVWRYGESRPRVVDWCGARVLEDTFSVGVLALKESY